MSGERSAVARHKELLAIWATPPGLGRLSAVNHSILGKRFMLTAFVFFLIGGVLAMLMRAQLATSENAFMGHEAYNQIFTMHGTVMMFLFAIPMLEGLAIYFLPKMLGARDLAFPRLTAFAYWCYLFGALLLVAALAVGVAPRDGWFMYTPLSDGTFSPGINADVWLLGVTFVEISAVATAVELVVSVLKVRAGGMSLNRMPLFAWYILVTAAMMLCGFPPLILGSVLLEIQRAFDLPFFDPARGGDPLLWQHLFWLFGHPEVYIIFLPAAGVVSTLIPVFARRAIVGYLPIVASVIAVGFISFGLWVHHMYTVGIPHLALAFFSAASMLVAVPTAVQFFAWIATLWAGRPVLRLPLLYLGGFLFIFVAGGLTGVMLALVPFDWQVHDTHFVVAHFHYVLVGGMILPLLAGAYYWLPLLTGRMASDRIGQWAFWLIFIGFNATFLIMHLTGLLGMPRRVYTYGADAGWDLFNLVSSVGGFILSAGFALFILDMVLHWRYGDRATRNPWRAGTLEWAMTLPPPDYNFGSVPHVAGRDPLWDAPDLPAQLAAGQGYLGVPRNGWQETLSVDMVTGRPEAIIVLPRRSFVPLYAGLAMAVFFVSFLLSAYLLATAGLFAATCFFILWAWRNGFREDPQLLDAGRNQALPVHAVSTGSPGWWGLVFFLVANGTFFASLLFGYAFLWTVAPGWPPPTLIGSHPDLATALLLFLVLGFVSSRWALAANRRERRVSRGAGLAAAALAGIAGTGGFLAIPFHLLPAVHQHAYMAVVAVISGTLALHALVGALFAAFGLARCLRGFASPRRNLDLRLVQLWWGYTLVIGVAGLFAIFLFPRLMGA
jgi:cytochrome c oxidase subunit I+III